MRASLDGAASCPGMLRQFGARVKREGWRRKISTKYWNRQCSSTLLCQAPQSAPEADRILWFSAQLGRSLSVLSSFCRQGNTGKMQDTRRLTTIPMKKPRGGSLYKGYSLVRERISLAHVLLSVFREMNFYTHVSLSRLRIWSCLGYRSILLGSALKESYTICHPAHSMICSCCENRKEGET